MFLMLQQNKRHAAKKQTQMKDAFLLMLEIVLGAERLLIQHANKLIFAVWDAAILLKMEAATRIHLMRSAMPRLDLHSWNLRIVILLHARRDAA